MTFGPCSWTPTHTHHCVDDLAEWNAYPAEIKILADQLASLGLWAATGRKFGACPKIARPVICGRNLSEVDLIGLVDQQPTYMGAGEWIGLPWDPGGYLNVDPTRCRLDGPVITITQVTIDGVILAAANYRLDEEWWLVRTDGGQWPWWQDLSLPSGAAGTFVVTYTAGTALPAYMPAVAGGYALELARSLCGSSACRLPGRVTSIIRQGVSYEMVDPTMLLEADLTGLPEIDVVIRATNPNHLTRPLRVLVPGATARTVSV